MTVSPCSFRRVIRRRRENLGKSPYSATTDAAKRIHPPKPSLSRRRGVKDLYLVTNIGTLRAPTQEYEPSQHNPKHISFITAVFISSIPFSIMEARPVFFRLNYLIPGAYRFGTQTIP